MSGNTAGAAAGQATSADAAPTSAVDIGIPFLLAMFALLAAAGAVLRVFDGSLPLAQRLDETTLLYLGVAGALLLLRQVKTLAFGSYKIEFEQVRRIAEEAREAAVAAGDLASSGLATASAPPQGAQAAAAATAWPKPGPVPDDPWKGVFGERSEHNGRRLSATVRNMPGQDKWFLLKLEVRATSRAKPLSGDVQFFLHDTFRPDRPIVQVGPNGRAELALRVWGAFTVGALADGGATQLELDLAELPGVPGAFLEN